MLSISVFIILSILNFTLIKKSLRGSDHFYHLGLINGIKYNHNKFLAHHPDIIDDKYFAYPQFFHFLLSLLPRRSYERYYDLISFSITALAFFMYFIFLFTIYPFLEMDASFTTFSFFSLLIYVFTPFSYAVWNAKNRGLSVRGFGLLCGQFYLYFIIWYYFYDNPLFLIGVFLIGFITIVSSQFAFQFVLFSSPIFVALYQNLIFIAVPIFAFLLFYLIMPNICKNYIKGQLNRKKIYYKFIAPFRFKTSIWRYLVWDFWKNLKNNYKQALGNLYYNSLISVFVGFPFLPVLFVSLLRSKEIKEIVLTNSITTLSIPVVVSLIIFILTSFKKTRFLGQPERYIEFVIPFVSILSVQLFLNGHRTIIYTVLIISLLLVLFETILLSRIGGGSSRKLELLVKSLENLCSNMKDVRIFSNNADILGYFLGKEWKILKPNIFSEFAGTFHFTDIFPHGYGPVSSKVILPLIKDYEINLFILDLKFITDYDFLKSDKSVRIEERITTENYKVFSIYKAFTNSKKIN